MAVIGKYFKKLRHFGLNRYCPVCDSRVRKFHPYGLLNRSEAMCPVCNMLERHRAIWLFLQEKTNLTDGKPKRMMHVAPEKEMAELFKKTEGIDYLSVDLYNLQAMEKVDITDIPYGEDEFDVIYCCHVLEHIPDDLKAMREFYRILRPGGWALISVPLGPDKTFEDSTVTDPKEREKVFGQNDHVRVYGTDVTERLESAGFEVECIAPSSFMSGEELVRCAIGVETDRPLFFCRKLD